MLSGNLCSPLFITRTTIQWNDERLTVKGRNGFLQNFPTQISESRVGQFWQQIATNFKNHQDFLVIFHAFRGRFVTIMRKYNA